MRTLALTVLLLGCSPSADPVALDAAEPPPPVEAGPDPAETGAPDSGACTPSATCVPLTDSCTGGFRYGCFGGTCPTGDVGSCRALPTPEGTSMYAEACCERSACTRSHAPLDQQCAEDGGVGDGWTCPPGAKPPGKCRAYGLPLPTASQPGDYCCLP